MAKDPAFLFYSKDFLSGVSDLTMEERGQYITLLCLQHQKGPLSEKMIKINIPDAAADVLAKFRQNESGKYFNVRLEEEREKRLQHTEKQRQRALDGWKKRKKKQATANAAALPLVNANVNKDKGVVGEKDFTINKNHMMQIVNNQDEHATWIETYYRKFRLANKKLGIALKDFNDALVSTDTAHKTMKDYKQHFFNWMNIQESKGKLEYLKK